jgi:hypothetical protein
MMKTLGVSRSSQPSIQKSFMSLNSIINIKVIIFCFCLLHWRPGIVDRTWRETITIMHSIVTGFRNGYMFVLTPTFIVESLLPSPLPSLHTQFPLATSSFQNLHVLGYTGISGWRYWAL